MNTAMILCAGFGTRMQEYTKDIPKPMLPLLGKPLLAYTIEHLAALDITNIVINLHYHSDKITSYFGNGDTFGVTIHYVYEETPLGTAGAVKNAEHLLAKSDNFLVLYGDIVSNEDYTQLYALHNSKENAIGTIVLHERIRSNSVVKIDENNKVTRFIERPTQDVRDKKQNWVNSGLYIFNKKILDFIPEHIFYDFPKDVFGRLVEKSLLYGYPLKGYRCAVDSPERYLQVEADLKERNLF